jgi:hypothetical protein
MAEAAVAIFDAAAPYLATARPLFVGRYCLLTNCPDFLALPKAILPAPAAGAASRCVPGKNFE